MSRFVVAIFLVFMFATPLIAPAGDEVDYSAPYLVVEDGELVTKYPAKEHEGDSPQQQDGVGEYWTIVALAIAGVIVLLLGVRRRRRK